MSSEYPPPSSPGPPPPAASELPGLAGWLWSLGAMLAIALILWWASAQQQAPYIPLQWSQLQPEGSGSIRPWQWLVIHHSGAEIGDAAGIDRDHQSRGWEGLGYHFVIGNGQPMTLARVEWSFRWNLQRHGAHVGVGDMNQQAIGICLIGNFDLAPADPLQYYRAVELSALLLIHIPTLSLDRLVGHGEVGGARTNCPGAHFDMQRFRAEVAQKIQQLTSGTVTTP